MAIEISRVLEKLDSYLNRDRYGDAKRHLEYWLAEANALGDSRSAFAILNELVGLCRKCEMKEEGLAFCDRLLQVTEELSLTDQVSGAMAYLNTATAYKSFGMTEDALSLYEKAKTVYEENAVEDTRMAGLCNNMALALTDAGRYAEAEGLYERALSILKGFAGTEPEMAVTHLNLADLILEECGAEDGEERILSLVEKAKDCLNAAYTGGKRDGNLAFVMTKCIPSFSYYGYFLYAKELKERVEEIKSVCYPSDFK